MSSKSRVVGTTELIQKMRRIRAASVGILEDRELGERIAYRVRQRFKDAVAPDGTKWPPLTAGVIAKKRSKGYANPSKPLQATGRLLNSIKVIHGKNVGLLAGNTGLGFRVGVSDPVAAEYGRLHNAGLAGQEKRQFIGLSRLDVVAVSGMLRRRLKSIAKG